MHLYRPYNSCTPFTEWVTIGNILLVVVAIATTTLLYVTQGTPVRPSQQVVSSPNDMSDLDKRRKLPRELCVSVGGVGIVARATQKYGVGGGGYLTRGGI